MVCGGIPGEMRVNAGVGEVLFQTATVGVDLLSFPQAPAAMYLPSLVILIIVIAACE